ncbi:MAG: preprotein translocase subunit YajC, partial [Clostridia bacterium]
MNFLSHAMMTLTDAAAGAAATTATAAGAPVQGAPVQGAGLAEILSMIIPLVLMFVVFYFLLIRPQHKKDKKVKN